MSYKNRKGKTLLSAVRRACWTFGLYGAFITTGCGLFSRNSPIAIDRSEVIPLEMKALPSPGSELVLLWPDDRNLKFNFDYKKLDTRGNIINPLVKLQMQMWVDDSTGTWFNLSLDAGEYAVFDNSIIVYSQKIDTYFYGKNLRFRAALEGKGYLTSYVRLAVSIRLYPALESGIPLQPERLQLDSVP